MTSLNIVSLDLANGATAAANYDDLVDIATGPEKWSYSAVFPGLKSTYYEVLASIEVEVSRGSVGLLTINAQGLSSGDEFIIRAGDGRRTVEIVLHPVRGDRLCLRNVEFGQSQARVFHYETWERRPVNIDAALDRLLPKMLLNPGSPAMIDIAERFPHF